MWTLLQCDDVPEIAAHLSRTEGYGEALSTLVPKETTRVQLEDRLKLIPARRAGNFLPYLTGRRRRLLSAWIGRSEASALKKALRFVLTKHGDRETIRARSRRFLPVAALRPASLEPRLQRLFGSPPGNAFFRSAAGTPETPGFRGREPFCGRGGDRRDRPGGPLQRRACPPLRRGTIGAAHPGDPDGLPEPVLVYRSLRYYDLTPTERVARLLPSPLPDWVPQ